MHTMREVLGRARTTAEALAILEGKVGEGDTVVVDAAGDELTVSVSDAT